MMGPEAQKHMMPWLVGAAVKSRVLSERVLVSILQALSEDGEHPSFHMEVDLGDGESDQLLQLCLKCTEQSYELACTEFDEPHLAILAVYALCHICKSFPSGKVSLQRIAGLNDVAAARVATYAISTNLGLECSIKGSFLDFLLLDFRALIKHRHDMVAGFLVQALPTLHNIVDVMGETAAQSFELVYLFAEFFLARGDYWKVIRIPQMFEGLWEAKSKDKEMHKLAQPSELCIAKALEATGELNKALEKFRSCHATDLHELESCVAGESLYASIKWNLPLRGIESLQSRDFGEGRSVLFFHQKEGTRRCLKFGFLDIANGSFDEKKLPIQGKNRFWQDVRIIPDVPSRPLRVLVAARERQEGEDQSEVMVSTFMEAIMPASERSKPLERVEVWEYSQTEWRKIPTRGSSPDRLVITRTGSGCATIGTNVVVFGGMDIAGSPGSSAGAFILDANKEWFRIPHPYSPPHPYRMRQTGETLPAFDTVVNVEINGRPMLAMLRKGEPEVNTKRNNEVIPKYALDLFGMTSGMERPEAFWLLDVNTKDQCGYIAVDMKVACKQVGQKCLVLALETMGRVVSRTDDGRIVMNFDEPASSVPLLIVNVLDFKNMEWRGLKIHNAGLLQDHMSRGVQFELIANTSLPDTCHVLFYTSQECKLVTISNIGALEDCLTKKISANKKHSKKNTLSYRLRQAENNHVRPLRECAFCRAFEGVRDNFKRCSRCKTPFYCSVKCQHRHWKAHKLVCRTVDEKEADDDFAGVD